MSNRFAITFLDNSGLRILAHQNTSQNFFDKKSVGKTYLTNMLKNNSSDTIKQIFGTNPSFQVTPIECYPSGDSKRTVFSL
jgi:hypothetical protein